MLRRMLIAWLLLSATGSFVVASEAPADKPSPAADLREIQNQIDLATLGQLAMLDNRSWRYSTVDSWSRKVVLDIYGPGKFEGLDPVVAAMELLFNADAYNDRPVLFVKDIGVLRDLTKHPISVSEAERKQIYKLKRVSHDFIMSPAVQHRIEELNGEVVKGRAMQRLGRAKHHYERLQMLFTIVPCPNGQRETPWIPVSAVLKPEERARAGLTDAQAQEVFETFREFGRGWIARDVGRINAGIAAMNKLLPTLAPEGLYPTAESRQAEMKYRRWELIKKGWGLYIVAFFVSIFAVATRYGWARLVGLVLLAGAMGLHGYDLWMRWQVVGRVPVANMYEAVVSSAWMASLLGLVLELFLKKRVYLLGAAFLGFFGLALPELLPDQVNNNIQTMMPILDDIMLRIHTVLIIASYGVITLAFAAANCYLFTAAIRDKVAVAQATIGAEVGALGCLVLAYYNVFETAAQPVTAASRFLGMASEGAILVTQFIAALVVAVTLCAVLSRLVFVAIGGRAAGNGHSPSLAASGFPVEKDILEEYDLAHRVLIYIATVALFVGIVLGAIWADYSWGRPWGWDPKEVFALNTWLVYAILIHVRFVTKRRALWASVLSVAGFAAMQFNWWVVNFYIVGLHSYA